MKAHVRHHGIEPLALDLVRAGMGSRDAARILGVGASLISYYRKKAGIPEVQAPFPTREELVARLPADLRARVDAFLTQHAVTV